MTHCHNFSQYMRHR